MNMYKQPSVGVYCIPDFLVRTLEARGMSLGKLDDMLALVKNSTRGGDISGPAADDLMSWFKDNLSKSDISYLYTCNRSFIKLLNGDIYRMSDVDKFVDWNLYELFANHTDYLETFNNFVNGYLNHEISIDSIILSNKVSNPIVTLKPTDKTLFVIVSQGYTNAFTHNSLTFRGSLRAYILDGINKYYGEGQATNHDLFITYLKNV